MKQTAVEWLVDKYIIVGGITKTMVEQAKEMEKEQIMDACKQCSYSYEEAEQYYNETYEQDKQG